MDGAIHPGDDLPAFVREVMLPGCTAERPRIDPAASRFRLRLGESHIHRWGVYADEDIPPRRRVIEYNENHYRADRFTYGLTIRRGH